MRYRTNRFGYRDRLDRRAERTPGVARVGLLGDSLAAGWGVEFEETFGARFERATGIEMVNASRNGGCALWFVPQARHLRSASRPIGCSCRSSTTTPRTTSAPDYSSRSRSESGSWSSELRVDY